jgi:cytochrome b
MKQKIHVWDFPTRAFHWLLVIAIAFQYITVEILDNAIQLHFYGGYVTLGLIIFRLFWGIWGGFHARFVNFLTSPATTYQYAKSLGSQQNSSHLGHNPMGAYSAIAILSIIATQAVSGLFTTDDIFSEGPYYSAVSPFYQDIASWLHHNLFTAIWVFLAFHLGAMLFYKLVKKQVLVKAMITGHKELSESESHVEQPLKTHVSPLWFLITVALTVVLVYCIVEVWAPEVVDDFYY